MKTLKIESGIEIPALARTSKYRELLTSCKKNDSFVVESTAKSSVYKQAQALGLRLVSRTVDEKFSRLWVVEKGVKYEPKARAKKGEKKAAVAPARASAPASQPVGASA